MRKWIVAVAVVFLAYEAHEVYAQMQLREIMANKLQAAQRLLGAIAVADFAQIGSEADKLIQITNRAEWIVYKNPKYELHSNEFRRSVEKIARKAREKNIDGVTLAYMDMTMSCVRCHEYVREIREAALTGPPPALARR